MKDKEEMNYVLNMEKLLIYCSKCPELYNKVSNILYRALGKTVSAELTLLCTYVAQEATGGNKE